MKTLVGAAEPEQPRQWPVIDYGTTTTTFILSPNYGELTGQTTTVPAGVIWREQIIYQLG